MTGELMYIFNEKQIIDALEANGFVIGYGGEWIPPNQRNDRGGMELKSAFEYLLRERNIL